MTDKVRSIDKEFLQDYQQETLEAYKKFAEDAMRGDFSSCCRYFLKRWRNPSQPISRLGSHLITGEIGSIWKAIPLARTAFVPIVPADPSQFEELNGFKIREIPDIIDYIKAEGKVQIALRTFPINYGHLGFLEPLFRELRPPALFLVPPETYFDPKEVKKFIIEFDTLARVGKLMEKLTKWSLNVFGSTKPGREQYESFINNYVFLRL